MHDILDMVMMATTAMSKKNATIQENYFKSGTKELCMSAALSRKSFATCLV